MRLNSKVIAGILATVMVAGAFVNVPDAVTDSKSAYAATAVNPTPTPVNAASQVNPTATPAPASNVTPTVDPGAATNVVPTTTPVPLTYPQKLKVSTNGKKKLYITWKKVSAAKGYELQYSSSKYFKGAKTINMVKARTEKNLTGLKSKKTYYFRIRSFIRVKNVKVYSSWSPVKSKKTK